MNFSIGETVGDYRIVEELGRGGMGRVFKVEHTITKRLEAMKVLEGGRPDTPEQTAASLREIQVQARLDHPNIAAVHNAFCVDGDMVLVMELIDGCSLRQLLESGRMPLATALDYTCLTLSALSYAHAHGVIHRDVSPANIMVSSSGVLKLTDFGLARGPSDVQVSRSGAPLGSPYYMSPEQVRGTTPADARSDVYSVGVLLYELATGKKPFDGESAFSVMADQVDKPPRPPIEVESSLPNSLNSAILRSLEKDPPQRFPSADQFQQALLQVRNTEIVIQPAQPAILRRSRVAWAATVVSVVIALAVAVFLIGRQFTPTRIGGSAARERSRANNPQQRNSVARPKNKAAKQAPTQATRTQSPPRKQLTRTQDEADTQSPSEPGGNRLKNALGKVWHLVYRKSSFKDEDSQVPSESP